MTSKSLHELAGVDPQWLPTRGVAWVLFSGADKEDRSSGHYIRWCPTLRRAREAREYIVGDSDEKFTRPICLSFHGKRTKEVPLTLDEMMVMPEGDHAWVLFDTSNGDEIKYRYLWWFDTRREAREHRAKQHANPNWVRLSRPVRMMIL